MSKDHNESPGFSDSAKGFKKHQVEEVEFDLSFMTGGIWTLREGREIFLSVGSRGRANSVSLVGASNQPRVDLRHLIKIIPNFYIVITTRHSSRYFICMNSLDPLVLMRISPFSR